MLITTRAALIAVGLALAGVVFTVEVGQGAAPRLARAAAADWRAEFEDVCSKTQDAMALSVEELTALVKRCDALAPEIEKLAESQRKVYARRLKTCRDLYQYVIEYKQQPKS